MGRTKTVCSNNVAHPQHGVTPLPRVNHLPGIPGTGSCFQQLRPWEAQGHAFPISLEHSLEGCVWGVEAMEGRMGLVGASLWSLCCQFEFTSSQIWLILEPPGELSENISALALSSESPVDLRWDWACVFQSTSVGFNMLSRLTS